MKRISVVLRIARERQLATLLLSLAVVGWSMLLAVALVMLDAWWPMPFAHEKAELLFVVRVVLVGLGAAPGALFVALWRSR